MYRITGAIAQQQMYHNNKGTLHKGKHTVTGLIQGKDYGISNVISSIF